MPNASNNIFDPRHSDDAKEKFGDAELEGVDYPARRERGLGVELKESRNGLVKIKKKDLDYGDCVFLIADWPTNAFHFVDSRDFAEFYRQDVPQRSFSLTFVKACSIKSYKNALGANAFKEAIRNWGFDALSMRLK